MGVKSAEKDIMDYLQTVVEKKGGESVKRDFRKMPYYWRNGALFNGAKNPLAIARSRRRSDGGSAR